MATYEFKCPSCGEIKEVSSPITEDVIAPTCSTHGSTMERNYSSPGIIFKGNGWAGKS